jgi:hypothetical protein
MDIVKIETLYQSAHKNLVKMLVDFGKKSIHLQSVEHPKYILRENLSYRMESSVFHLQLISYVKQRGIEKLREAETTDNPVYLIKIVREVFFTFDDLIFNLLSQIDYLGNLIGYIYLGEHKKSLQWNGIVKTCRDPKNKFENKELRDYILSEDKRFIDHLYRYRSDLIHYNKDGSEAVHCINEREEDSIHTLSIEAPEKFRKVLKNLRIQQDIDIIDLASRITEEVFIATDNILRIMAADIIPKTKMKMEAIVKAFKDENGIE